MLLYADSMIERAVAPQNQTILSKIMWLEQPQTEVDVPVDMEENNCISVKLESDIQGDLHEPEYSAAELWHMKEEEAESQAPPAVEDSSAAALCQGQVTVLLH